MAVEITILSGQRQGERLVLDGTKIRAGAEPTCDIVFDPSADSSARDRAVALCLLDDGWYIQSTGHGQVFVNQSPVVGLTRLKSGSVVRMSEFGPEFEFRVVASGHSSGRESGGNALAARLPSAHAPSSPPAPSIATTPSLARAPSVAAAPLAPPPPPVPAEPPLLAASPSAPAAASPPPSSPRDSGRLAVMAGFGVLALLLVLVLFKLSSPPAVVVVPSPAPPASDSASAASADRQPAVEGVPGKADSATSPPVSAAAIPASPATDPLWAQVSGGVLLIQVEKAGQFWPFAGCCAIAENVALTSAREAIQLGVWLHDPQSGFKGWVTHPATGLKLPIQGTRIYAVRVSSPDQQKPNDWLYTNLGLVIVDGSLPKTVALAGPDDWAQLAPGKPVHAFCYVHEGDVITPEDRLALGTAAGKILFINAHPELPGKPRVLGVKADLPKFPQGSPLVNAQGKVVAVYSATVAELEGQSQGGPGIENMHYATVIHPGVIDLWLKKSDGTAWVSTAELGLPAPGRGSGAEKQTPR